jgi:hypothetical protein
MAGTLPSPGELKKLAAACRKAGITHFKCGDVEFTLGEEKPKPQRKASASTPKQSKQSESVNGDGWDTLTEEQKMFYSVGGMPLDTLVGGEV